MNSKRLTVIFLFLLSFGGNVLCQELDVSDIKRIDSHVREAGPLADRHVRYGFGRNNRTLNPSYHLFSSGMYVYQRCISPVIVRKCAYSPSCSAYSKALIREYGLLKGSICTADRLMRCNRISLADPDTYQLIDRSDGHIHETVDRYRIR